MSVISRPGPITTASSGMPRSRATFSVALTHASPAIPVIRVNLVTGARSRVEGLRVLSPPPGVGECRAGDRRQLVGQLGGPRRRGPPRPVRDGRRGFVELPELDTVRV